MQTSLNRQKATWNKCASNGSIAVPYAMGPLYNNPGKTGITIIDNFRLAINENVVHQRQASQSAECVNRPPCAYT